VVEIRGEQREGSFGVVFIVWGWWVDCRAGWEIIFLIVYIVSCLLLPASFPYPNFCLLSFTFCFLFCILFSNFLPPTCCLSLFCFIYPGSSIQNMICDIS